MVFALAAQVRGREPPQLVVNEWSWHDATKRAAAIGWVHNDYIKITAGQTRRDHIEAAKENYRRAVDILLKAESHKALSAVDRKNLEEMRAIIEGLEKLR